MPDRPTNIPMARRDIDLQLAILPGPYALRRRVRTLELLARDLSLARLHVGLVEQHRVHFIPVAGSSWHCVLKAWHARITTVLRADTQA